MIVTDNSEVIANMIKRIDKLEAQKAEMANYCAYLTELLNEAQIEYDCPKFTQEIFLEAKK